VVMSLAALPAERMMFFGVDVVIMIGRGGWRANQICQGGLRDG
jgi:hypoxanthine phosphoribosyltransferase